MGFADEMAQAAKEEDAEMGESFTYDGGTKKLTGFFSDTDPEMVFLQVGKKTQRALICDVAVSAFASTAPAAGKKLIYSGDGKTYMVRLVHPITGGKYRLHIYQL